MNKVDKAKLKVLIKMILIHKSPDSLTANQLSYFINMHKWGFKSEITSTMIGKLLKSEVDGKNSKYMTGVKAKKGRNKLLNYYYEDQIREFSSFK